VSLALPGAESYVFPQPGLTLFGGIRDAAPDAWGRRVIEARVKAEANGLPESTYLLAAGSNRVGALDIRATLDAPPHSVAGAVLQLQGLLDAAEAVEAGRPVPEELAALLGAGVSLGGARPKAAVVDDAGVGWVAKFPSRTDRYSVTA